MNASGSSHFGDLICIYIALSIFAFEKKFLDMLLLIAPSGITASALDISTGDLVQSVHFISMFPVHRDLYESIVTES